MALAEAFFAVDANSALNITGARSKSVANNKAAAAGSSETPRSDA